MSAKKDDIAHHILYRTYWGFMLRDILVKTDREVTEDNKNQLHELHKAVLGYKTIAGRSHDVVSMFLFEVCVYWASEHGIFVRTKGDQPIDIEWRPLKEVWHLL